MHQHPRPPAPQATSARSNLSRSAERRESENRPTSPAADPRVQQSRGLGIETESGSIDPAQSTQPSKEAVAKLNQIISNYHTKAALIILHSRVELPPSYNKGSDTPRVNRWFNVEIEDTDVLREQLRTWRTCDATENRPPPLIIETYLDTTGLTNNQSLVALDENGKRWDVLESLAASREAHPVRPPSSRSDDVILERWRVELGDMPGKLPTDLGSILPTVYKKSIILFRSLFTYSKFLPAWKFTKRTGRLRTHPALRIKYRIVSGLTTGESPKPDHLTVPLYDSSSKVVETYSFGVTESPAGPFSVHVTYRTSCDFRVDDSEALLSSRFMGADDDIFRPSLPSRDDDVKAAMAEIGSVPVTKRTIDAPDPSRAYGSLSTFHQVGPTTSASPLSALRAARESGASSPSPPGTSLRKPLGVAKVGSASRAAILAGEGSSSAGRRPSISFQPFKAPPLSASPSLVDPPLGASPRSLPSRADAKNMPPPSIGASNRKSLPSASDNAGSSANSASPRPATISRYSSAFSHRRGRPSSGGVNRIEDDTSSGKASATSSAQPGSGLLAEVTGTSAESIHADDENISEFLKMLDLKKDLLTTTSPGALEVAARKATATSAALARFQRMRDSNAALSDSMSSSLLLQRSSNSSSKQLSGVPPMVAGTSTSTASSPGKPISPHTPHTPAIPSRLSSNSIVEYTHPANNDGEGGSPLEENTSDDTAMDRGPSTVTAIDIPTSPRVFPPVYRRSSSAAHRRRSVTVDEEEIFPFNMRSVSLGAEEQSHHSLSALHRQQEYEGAAPRPDLLQREQHRSSGNEAEVTRASDSRESGLHRGPSSSGPITSSMSSTHHIYQPRFGHSRFRGQSGGPHSLSSASSSLARGAMVPQDLIERDHERDGTASGSGSATSTAEDRRAGRRTSTGRGVPPQSTQPEEDEPLLFAMSDFGVSRRSLEESRHGNHSADPSSAPGSSRRGSGRRGGGLSGFPAWS